MRLYDSGSKGKAHALLYSFGTYAVWQIVIKQVRAIFANPTATI